MREHGGQNAMHVNDAFEIASITHIFNAVVIMQLAEESKLEVDPDILEELR